MEKTNIGLPLLETVLVSVAEKPAEGAMASATAEATRLMATWRLER
jgi:hypothetical protein